MKSIDTTVISIAKFLGKKEKFAAKNWIIEQERVEYKDWIFIKKQQ